MLACFESLLLLTPDASKQEFFVKKKDRLEVVCMIGVYGLLVSAVQLYPFSLHYMIPYTFIQFCNRTPSFNPILIFLFCFQVQLALETIVWSMIQQIINLI